MTYTPKPIDTSRVQLDAGLVPLLARLAENAHEIWAVRRISEGWICGAERDDQSKTTPLLVPYEQLPESERQLDRELVESLLKAIVALGYRVQRVEGIASLERSRGDTDH